MSTNRRSNFSHSTLGRSLINSKTQNSAPTHRNTAQSHLSSNFIATYDNLHSNKSTHSNLKSLVEESNQLETYIATKLASQTSFESLRGKLRFLPDHKPLDPTRKTIVGTNPKIQLPRRPKFYSRIGEQSDFVLHQLSTLSSQKANSLNNSIKTPLTSYNDNDKLELISESSDLSCGNSNKSQVFIQDHSYSTTKVTLKGNQSENKKTNAKSKQISTAELEKHEYESFLEWRRLLSKLEDEGGYVLTPFEKNLEVWKQLWRVLEKSDIILEILDARNPLLFHVPDLVDYAHELNPRKQVIIVINKSDFLTHDLRQRWFEYFQSKGVQTIFFSAIRELFYQGAIRPQHYASLKYDTEEELSEYLPKLDLQYINNSEIPSLSRILDCHSLMNLLESKRLEYIRHEKMLLENSSEEKDTTKGFDFTVGLVGYPNVGKSSMINSLFGSKKVSMSRQPGKTKHFQTLKIPNSNITLCDCPGLVFPSVVTSKSHLLINGITSINYFRGSYLPAIQLICDRIPHQLLETYKLSEHYLLNSSFKAINESSVNSLNASKFLNELALTRKFFSGGKGGQTNLFRASALVISDFITGRLLYNHPPPEDKSLEESLNLSTSPQIDQPSQNFYSDFTINRVENDLSEKLAQQLILENNQKLKAHLTKRGARKNEKMALKDRMVHFVKNT